MKACNLIGQTKKVLKYSLLKIIYPRCTSTPQNVPMWRVPNFMLIRPTNCPGSRGRRDVAHRPLKASPYKNRTKINSPLNFIVTENNTNTSVYK